MLIDVLWWLLLVGCGGGCWVGLVCFFRVGGCCGLGGLCLFRCCFGFGLAGGFCVMGLRVGFVFVFVVVGFGVWFVMGF